MKFFRGLEKNFMKLAKLKLDILYFKNCLDLGLFPKHLNLKTPKLKVYQDLKTLKCLVLRNQISILEKDVKTTTSKIERTKGEVKAKTTWLEFIVLVTLLNRAVRKKCEETVETHKRKLVNLWKRQRNASPDCLKNLSKRTLSIKEEEALRYGLKHHITPAKVDTISIKTTIEKMVNKLFFKTSPGSGIPGKIPKKVLDTIRHSADSFMNASKQMLGTRLNKTLHGVLNGLRKDKSIKVCSYDKGNGVVILDTDEYNKKLDEIVLDKSKFQEVKIDENKPHPIISKERSISRFLSTNIKKFVDESIFREINPSGSQPGKIYGLCKVHKTGNPLRPVVSMLNTAEYHLAKYLDRVIKPNLPSRFMLNSTKAFIDRIKEFIFGPDSIIVSFDVVSLFTNIPLKETLDLVTDHVYNSPGKPRYEKKHFRKLLSMATGGYFLYNGKLYCQVDGVTMGSPLGPTLANFFLAYFENKFMLQNHDFIPKLYCRFIDDIFCVFNSMLHVNMFLELLNNLHPNLKFTTELGPKSLAFLDTEIILDLQNLNFGAKVYRKKTNTNVILNWAAFCPENWKLGLVHCLLNRAYVVCNTWTFFHNEVEKLRDIFKSNGYPQKVFDNCLSKFLDQKFNGKSKEKDEDTENVVIVCLPYHGYVSDNFKKKLTSVAKSLKVTLRVVFRSCKIGQYFSLKDVTPTALKAKCVYKYTCTEDQSKAYIGKTIRHLAIRCKEHLSESNSAIFNHTQNCQHCKGGSLRNFKILNTGNSDLEIRIMEALQIKRHNPILNNQLTQKGASYYLNVF